MKHLQVAISFDCTGSMNSVLQTVRRSVSELLTGTFSKYPRISISILVHGNLCDKAADRLQYIPFTSDIESLVDFVKKPRQIHGGDAEAAYEQVMQTCAGMDWDPEALKILCIIGDQVPCTKAQYKREKLPYVDWKAELERLKEKHVQIYSIQALSSGLHGDPIAQFYQDISRQTDGVYMQLQQFSQITDILEMIILGLMDEAAEAGQANNLERFREERKIRNHGMINVYKAIKRQPQDGAEPVAPILPVMSKLDKSVLASLIACPAAKYQVIEVLQDAAIDVFVKENQLEFKVGYGFYEFTQPSIIQNDKAIVVFNRVTGQLYEGDQARQLFGIKTDCKTRQKPIQDSEYTAFIQSTSYNRKLLAGTKFLYVAKDFTGALPDVKPSYIPLAPEQQQNVKKQIQDTQAALEVLKTQLTEIHAVRESLVDPDFAALIQQFSDRLNGFVKF